MYCCKGVLYRSISRLAIKYSLSTFQKHYLNGPTTKNICCTAECRPKIDHQNTFTGTEIDSY